MTTKFLRLAITSVSALFAALTVMPHPAVSQPQVAEGYVIEQNCPNIDVASLGVPADWNSGQMAFSENGKKLFITYLRTGDGQVHVRDLNRCTQKVLIANIDTPLGIAVHPYTGHLYITHRYLNPEYNSGTDPLYKKYRSAVSIYDSRTGDLLVDKWVKGFAPSIIANVPASGEVGNGLQGLTFDRAANLYMVCNLNVWEKVSDPPDFYATGPLYKVNHHGEVSVFATGLRASLDLVIAETDGRGEATAFYAGDNGEGLFCSAITSDPASNDCAEREVSGSTPLRAITRMYYDELNYVVKGGHYGYPESAATVAFDEAKNVTHIGPLWNFDRVPGAGFGPPGTPGWPVPTGLALLKGRWGKVKDPLFVMFWLGRRLDMFTGPNRTQQTTLVSNLAGRGMDVVVRPQGREVFFMEDQTRTIWTIWPDHPWAFHENDGDD